MTPLFGALLICAAPQVHDGDSLRCGKERIRLANIDAPELRGSARCSPASVERLAASRNPAWCDHDLATRSAAALRSFLSSGPVGIVRLGRDAYGRTLARVNVNGRDAGDFLVASGLAREWRD